MSTGGFNTRFQQRLGKGAKAALAFEKLLRQHGVAYAHTGHESLPQSPHFKAELKESGDLTSVRLRFMPDYAVVIAGRTHLFELKNSSGIERDAYDAYMAMIALGWSVALVWPRDDRFFTIRPDRLVFDPMPGSVYDMDVPVDDGVWRNPRKLSSDDRAEYLRRAAAKAQNTSGCPFAFVDFDRTPQKDLGAWLESYMFS